jgi:hypothetical protein
MPHVFQKPVRLISEIKPVETGALLEMIEWSDAERKARALKWGGMCFGAGVVCVIFPLVHFVLVPGLILASPFLALQFYKQESWVKGGEGPCPNCGKTLKIGAGKPKFPLRDLCTECRNEVRIELTS